ncbi:fructose-bisphosphate aldolase [Candidatus Peregrinibacteria bacterium]|nr:fructose-bisphosphate aldolase [Candidatus Peregrinibacteria bacterium]
MPKTTSIERDPLHFFRKLNYSAGEMARIRQIVRPSGRTIYLPYDQFIEHDCRHLDAESDAGNVDYIMKLAIDAGFNGVAFHYGISKRFWAKYDGQVPLILKVNGKTSFPSQANPISSLTCFVEDAVRLGASAVGYTMYYGTPRQDEDLPQLANVRKKCDEYGLPLIVWAYPRGEAVDKKGGKDVGYALESAARLATEMGASIIKSNLPKPAKPDYFENPGVPDYYKKVEKELLAIRSSLEQKTERARRIIKAASGVPVLFSGGEEIDENLLKENATACLSGGCFGFIFGRNIWKRPYKTAMALTEKLASILDKTPLPKL